MTNKTWKAIWWLQIWTHEHITYGLFWRAWWLLGYGWIYPFMWAKKAEGKPWAKPFGEGEAGTRRYLAS